MHKPQTLMPRFGPVAIAFIVSMACFLMPVRASSPCTGQELVANNSSPPSGMAPCGMNGWQLEIRDLSAKQLDPDGFGNCPGNATCGGGRPKL